MYKYVIRETWSRTVSQKSVVNGVYTNVPNALCLSVLVTRENKTEI